MWSAFPLLLGGSNSRYAFWLHVVPIAADRHAVTWYLLAHESQASNFTQARVDGELDMLATVHAEDMAACRSVQHGIESGMIDEFRLTSLEATIGWFHEWVMSRCGSG